MSRFEQMIHACEPKTRPRTSWSSSIWPSISCKTSKARKSASTSDALKPHATIASSSIYSLYVRIRCICPPPGCDNQYIIKPGRSAIVFVNLPPQHSNPVDGQLWLHRNDPDTPIMTVKLRGNPLDPAHNSAIENFNLLSVDGKKSRLSDYY